MMVNYVENRNVEISEHTYLSLLPLSSLQKEV